MMSCSTPGSNDDAAIVCQLATQQHQDQLAQRRAELTLQIAVLSEKKMAKLIDLIEEHRRDYPMLSSRVDIEAEAMARSLAPEESSPGMSLSLKQEPRGTSDQRR